MHVLYISYSLVHFMRNNIIYCFLTESLFIFLLMLITNTTFAHLLWWEGKKGSENLFSLINLSIYSSLVLFEKVLMN